MDRKYTKENQVESKSEKISLVSRVEKQKE